MKRRDLPIAFLATAAGALITKKAEAQTCVAPCYAITAAETLAGVTPSHTEFPPGDVRRYGATGNGTTDDAPAVQAACNVSAFGGPNVVYLPSTLDGYYFASRVTVASAAVISGDRYSNSFIKLTSDITAFYFPTNNAGGSVRDLQVFGSDGAGNVQPAIWLENRPHVQIERVQVSRCGWAIVLGRPGNVGSGCFEVSITDCRLASNKLGSINAESASNCLSVYNTQIGAGGWGIRIADSVNLSVQGGACESCTIAGIDIDASAADERAVSGAVIRGMDFENNACSAGNIRIGATARIRGVTVIGCSFSPGGVADAYAINPVRCNGLTVIGCPVLAGYGQDVWINTSSTDNINCTVIACDGTGVAVVHGGEVAFSGNNTGLRGSLSLSRQTVAESTSMTLNTALGNSFVITITAGGVGPSSFSINAPLSPRDGKRIKVTIRNSSGGVLGSAFWNSVFRLATWTQPASGFSRSIDFEYNGANWVEASRTPADVPN